MSNCASIHSLSSENQPRVKSLRGFWCECAPVERGHSAEGGGRVEKVISTAQGRIVGSCHRLIVSMKAVFDSAN